MVPEGGEQYHSSLRLKATMTFLHEKHGFKWGMNKIPVNGKIPPDEKISRCMKN
jgi:hypothetical protein